MLVSSTCFNKQQVRVYLRLFYAKLVIVAEIVHFKEGPTDTDTQTPLL